MLQGDILATALVPGQVQRKPFTIESLLAPLRVTANRCGLIWRSPFVVYTADKLEAVGLKAKAEEYVKALNLWREKKFENF